MSEINLRKVRSDIGLIRADEIIREDIQTRMLTWISILLVICAMLSLFGLIMLYSTSYHTDGQQYFIAQLRWLILAGIAGTMTFFVGYRKLGEWAIMLLLVLAIMLLACRLFYPAVNGAYRWLQFKSLNASLQPSEFLKVALPLFIGKYCADNFRHIQYMFSRHGALIPVLVTAAMCYLVWIGKDLGTVVLIFTMMLIMLFVAGLRVRWFVLLGVLGLLAFVFIVWQDPERLERVFSFRHAEELSDTSGYQLWFSLLALGSGSWTGVGFMESRMKASYLPEHHTDFILAVIGEELGFVALVLILLAYVAFFYFSLKICCNSTTKQGLFTGVGIVTVIMLQALINIGVVSGALPTKGFPAPLLSYGGSGLLMFGVALGVIINIGADAVHPNFNQELWGKLKLRRGKGKTQ